MNSIAQVISGEVCTRWEATLMQVGGPHDGSTDVSILGIFGRAGEVDTGFKDVYGGTGFKDGPIGGAGYGNGRRIVGTWTG